MSGVQWTLFRSIPHYFAWTVGTNWRHNHVYDTFNVRMAFCHPLRSLATFYQCSGFHVCEGCPQFSRSFLVCVGSYRFGFLVPGFHPVVALIAVLLWSAVVPIVFEPASIALRMIVVLVAVMRAIESSLTFLFNRKIRY